MAKSVRVKLNVPEGRKLLNSSEVYGDLRGRGNRIAAAAGPGFVARAAKGPDRGSVFIVADTAAARRAEAEDRALTRAIDAGR